MPDAEATFITSPAAQAGPVPARVLAALSAAADAEERGAAPIAASVDLLRRAGLLEDDGTADPARTARALMQVGGVNLSVGRLWEGHVNALHLIRLRGTSAQRDRVRKWLAQGALFGVWGADGVPPVTLSPGGAQLVGVKNFASGLGTLSHALVTVGSGPDVRLALIEVRAGDRADLSGWTVPGMRATASGSFDMTGIEPGPDGWIGGPGDYLREPSFVGGVWRIAALQAGASAGLVDRAAASLRETGRLAAEAQKTRLMTALMRVWAGMALTERAAVAASDPAIAAEDAVSLSISARLFTEEAALAAIHAVEQSLGLRHFAQGSPTGRMARDLSVYLRQAARDALLQQAADHVLGRDGGIGGLPA
ncbi:acyl-CoA dehydrogenase [Paracoccus stylophorae]|uniref:Acyl-CoA dehydrogenase n=1 Tax=Paracoccus stylophorae TaxID=659350 RepID=A0ABY7SUF6_9RHOB|nr:acyl-CoA dehydrogenase [Paracoccus stylophorae]WCR10682.1 acyl-CoA dehydrogenase [Paracoccus stylophorae]